MEQRETGCGYGEVTTKSIATRAPRGRWLTPTTLRAGRRPGAVTERRNAAFRQAVNAPAVRQRLETGSFEITGTATPDEFAAAIAADTEVFWKIVTAAGIKPE